MNKEETQTLSWLNKMAEESMIFDLVLRQRLGDRLKFRLAGRSEIDRMLL